MLENHVDLARFLAGADEGQNVLRENIRMHGEGVAHFLARHDTAADVGHRAAHARGLEPSRHEFERLVDRDVALQAAGHAVEELRRLLEVGLFLGNAVDELVSARNVGHLGRFIRRLARTEDRFGILVGVDNDLGNSPIVDVGQLDLFEHGISDEVLTTDSTDNTDCGDIPANTKS